MKKSLFDKLNLRPNERRLVIIVLIVVFIILNFIFVWPRFGDWGKIKARRNVTGTSDAFGRWTFMIPISEPTEGDITERTIGAPGPVAMTLHYDAGV